MHRPCDRKGKKALMKKASRIAKQAVKQGWTSEGRLDHAGLVRYAERYCFNPKSNDMLLKVFKQAERRKSRGACALLKGISVVTED